MFVHKTGVRARMFNNEACEVLKAKELTHVNDWSRNKRNEAIGHYRQTLIGLFSYGQCIAES